ncbi:uncharacterized protein K452DRAFT_283994 [Aplosporella prunicola CBS 121167]|uniref:NADP-dependent oxidoreductase domain-containing protein n=1 Tax=Aplosporella prunicola CBS 121167 TaxID=1176127 RepID=A0A6A6BNI0_9PEZI|nr:uncharacterized protein K452DRAFT_283994 [Aplosporella prunicola CBS 121167]KAF2145636.1 hypothetical protein K452DRAFT_283994 [Aplosporella prunicola CBS 121167]
MTTVAIAWVFEKGCCPIVGVSKESQLDSHPEGLAAELTEEGMEALEEEYKHKPLRVTGVED